jgi:hypothetical protein
MSYDNNWDTFCNTSQAQHSGSYASDETSPSGSLDIGASIQGYWPWLELKEGQPHDQVRTSSQ